MFGRKPPEWQKQMQGAFTGMVQELFVAVVAIAAFVSLVVAIGVCLVVK